MSLSKSPSFNLKAVLQETNIAADTLRAWERRYGLPMPQRTAGGHRLYSQYDIEIIKWLLTRQAEGLSISRAVDLWNEKTSAGIDLLADVIPSTHLQLPSIYIPAGTSLDSLRAEWIQACLDFNEARAEQILNQAFSMFSIESVCVEVLQKAMSEIGQLWYSGQASVQQEHFASGLAMRRLEVLLSSAPAPSRKQTIIVGCPTHEWHNFTALLVTLLLRRRGFNIVYLGANVPAPNFEKTAKQVNATLVILIAQTLISAAWLRVTSLILAGTKTPTAFGGRIFTLHPDLRENIAGHYLGNSIEGVPDMVEEILLTSTLHNPTARIVYEYAQTLKNTLQEFKHKRAHIESAFKASLPPIVANSEEFNTGIQFLGDNIIAALQIGDIKYVTLELEWIKALLNLQNRPPEELHYFMKAYTAAAAKHISKDSAPIIINWLEAQTKIV